MANRLPPAAQARLDRFAASPVCSSLLTVPSAAGLEAVGFEPVGEVLGATVATLSPVNSGGCGYAGTHVARVRLSGTQWGGYAAYLRTLRAGYDVALRRLHDETAALGADGVAGIRLTMTPAGENLREFVALGTAVRARSRTRPDKPFSTDLGGDDVAKLLLGGWVPVRLHVAVEIGMRHNDPLTMQQARPPRTNRTNVEVDGWTELLQKVRASVRTKLRAKIAGDGADGGLLSELITSTWQAACINWSDHVVQAIAIGTSVARFASPSTAPPATMTVLPLHDRGDRRR